MGFFRKLVKNVKDQAMRDQSMGMERMPRESRGGLSSLFGTMSTRRPRQTMVVPAPAPAPTGIEALINPMRTDPGGQEDMRKLMDMQRQTFRSFLAPPPAVQQAIPVTGQDLGLPMGPGGGIGSIPMPNIPIQLPEIPQTPIVMPLAPQIPIMPSFDVAPMPAMRLPRVRPDTKGLIER